MEEDIESNLTLTTVKRHLVKEIAKRNAEMNRYTFMAFSLGIFLMTLSIAHVTQNIQDGGLSIFMLGTLTIIAAVGIFIPLSINYGKMMNIMNNVNTMSDNELEKIIFDYTIAM